ncbi:unnamed protein product [Rhizophagus irregularis]|nr:unnamed protein product [Rhizophagus irregularis]
MSYQRRGVWILFKVSDTEANDFKGDKKITCWEISDFVRLVEEIRFLVNDAETPTGKVNEDNAYTTAKEI